jgi:hypothetical protein
MEVSELIKLVEDPRRAGRGNIKELQQLVNDFPYFQSAHLLLSIAAKRCDPSVYQQTLKKTAIVTTNRSHFFNLIQSAETSAEEAVTQIVTKPVQLPVPVAEEIISSPTASEEIGILKAAELSIEPAPAADLREESLEPEIARQVVSAFVEKEIIRTPELHKPVVPEEKPESFGDWLAFLKKNNGQSYSEIEEQVNIGKAKQRSKEKEEGKPEKVEEQKQKKKAIIDKIIEKNPGAIRVKEEQKFFTPETRAKESLQQNEHLVTETLAKIYALQGNVNKAVRAYEILSLKYPQKSAYFASLIQQLKNNQ